LFRVADVIRLHDRWVSPQKAKWHVTICPETRKFLRINSKDLFGVGFLIKKSDCDFLLHDSYVELNKLVRHFVAEVNSATILGRLPDQVCRDLGTAVRAARTLSPDEKTFILERLDTI